MEEIVLGDCQGKHSKRGQGLVRRFESVPSQLARFSWDFVFSYIKAQENAMAPHSSTLAWKIPWTEGPGRLQSMGSLRVRHD